MSGGYRGKVLIRDGILPGNIRLPERMSRTPAQGPLAGRTHDFDVLKSSFYEAMGWESQGNAAGRPLKSTLQKLGLHGIVS